MLFNMHLAYFVDENDICPKGTINIFNIIDI